MSTRDYKVFGTGEWYHLFTRGNGKSDIFRNARDYNLFLQRLRAVLGSDDDEPKSTMPRAPLDHPGSHGQGRPLTTGSSSRDRVRVTPLPRGAFSIAAYCLMPNHFHFLIQQNSEIPVSKLFLKLLTSYSMYFNRTYDHVGHVFQDRFKAVHIENNTQLLHVSAYIHQNPKVARLIGDAGRWEYSSYPEYLSEESGGLCDKTMILEQFRNVREYQRFVEDTFEDIRARKDVRDLMMDE